MDPKLQIEGHRISKTMRFHLKLLAEIKPYPCLYDHTNPNYNNTIVNLFLILCGMMYFTYFVFYP